MSVAGVAEDEHVPTAEQLVRENVRQLLDIERKDRERRDGWQERTADRITGFSGSMTFIWIHVAWFTFWVVANVGHFAFKAFDPFPFGLLTLIVSLEAIFLSTFVLLSQNRQSIASEERNILDLHMNLLAEEKLTTTLKMLRVIADKLDIEEECEIDAETFAHRTDLTTVAQIVREEAKEEAVREHERLRQVLGDRHARSRRPI